MVLKGVTHHEGHFRLGGIPKLLVATDRDECTVVFDNEGNPLTAIHLGQMGYFTGAESDVRVEVTEEPAPIREARMKGDEGPRVGGGDGAKLDFGTVAQEDGLTGRSERFKGWGHDSTLPDMAAGR